LRDNPQQLQGALLRELLRDSTFRRDDVVRGLAAPHFFWGRFHFFAADAAGCGGGGDFGFAQGAEVTRNGFCAGGKNILAGTLSIRFFFIATNPNCCAVLLAEPRGEFLRSVLSLFVSSRRARHQSA
jgi:hypothetical protein